MKDWIGVILLVVYLVIKETLNEIKHRMNKNVQNESE